MVETNSFWVYEKDVSNDRYGSLEKQNNLFSKIVRPPDYALFLNDTNKPLNFENLYPDSKSKLSSLCRSGKKGPSGIMDPGKSEVEKLEEATLAAQHKGIKKAVIKTRYVLDLSERKADQLSAKLIGEEDITKLFSEITARLYCGKKAYVSETKSYGVTVEDVLDLTEHIKAFNPSENYRLDLVKQIINDSNLWMSN